MKIYIVVSTFYEDLAKIYVREVLEAYDEIDSNYLGTGGIQEDPLFCDADNGDYTVRSDSPVLGVGQDGANMGAYGVGCEPIYGCTDNYALNYSSEVDISDNSTCEYPDNGDYSLSFDGGDGINDQSYDYVLIPTNNMFDVSDEQALTISANVTLNLGGCGQIFQAEDS